MSDRASSGMILSSLTTLWKESVAFFAWKNVRLFMLATLNTSVRSAGIVVRDFWWILLGLLIARLSGIAIVTDILALTMSFCYLLIVRPSIEMKNAAYYVKYARQSAFYFFMVLAVIATIFVPFKLASGIFGVVSRYPGSLIHGPFSIVFIAGLFLLDSKPNLSSVAQALLSALQFVVYCAPVMSLVLLLEYIAVYYTIDVPFAYFASGNAFFPLNTIVVQSALFILRHFLVLLLFSALSVFYVRVKHKHHKLFFSS